MEDGEHPVLLLCKVVRSEELNLSDTGALTIKQIKTIKKMETTEKFYIIRSDRAGIFFGGIKSQTPLGDKLMVEMTNTRRLWYWDGAASISQLAIDGTSNPEECKFTKSVDTITIMGVIEIIPCTAKAIRSINSVKEWAR